MGKRLEQTLHQREKQVSNEHNEGCTVSFVIREI